MSLACERVRQHGLADPRQVLDQQVPAREQAGEREPHLAVLAEHDAADRVDRAGHHGRRGGARAQLGFQ
jgi:hypothetical protein